MTALTHVTQDGIIYPIKFLRKSRKEMAEVMVDFVRQEIEKGSLYIPMRRTPATVYIGIDFAKPGTDQTVTKISSDILKKHPGRMKKK